MIALLLALSVSMAVSLFGTPLMIRVLRSRGIGQPIREDGPEGHFSKAGTPTMGGLAIVVAMVVGYLSGHVRADVIFTRAGILVVLLAVGGAIVGGTDDFLKVTSGKNAGLNKRAKMGGQVVLSTVFAYLAIEWANVPTRLSLFRFDGFGLELPTVLWVAAAFFMIIGTTNGVNLSDGLDGLCAGISSFTFSAFMVIGFWQFRHFSLYRVPQSLDLAVLAAACVGGLVGFLWWNAKPAQIFMGDTGSLALGAAAAGLALTMNVQLLLPIIGGVFVLETLSVMLQVATFRLMGGRRIFRMTPIHHHFELAKTERIDEKDMAEVNVVIRFWMVAAALTAIGLGLFYYDYLQQCPGTAGSRSCSAVPAPADLERGATPGPPPPPTTEPRP